MFLGTVPPAVCSILAEHAQHWPDGTEVYVACSGKLTLERTLEALDKGFSLHSNDVSLFTAALGYAATGRKLKVKVNADYQQEWGWLDAYLSTPVERAATVMLAMNMLQGMHRQNPYFQRIRRLYRERWDELHARTVNTLTEGLPDVSSFHLGDGVDWVEGIPRSAAVVSFPPFYAGGYEVMFKGIETVFDWPRPTYPELDDDRRDLMVERIMAQDRWLLGLDYELPGAEEFLRGRVKTTNRQREHLVYGNAEGTRIVGPRQRIEPIMAPYLGPGERVQSGPLQIHELTNPQFNGIRAVYLDKNTPPSKPSLTVAVSCGGQIVGAFATSHVTDHITRSQENSIPSPALYLLSDFPVRPTEHKHLAKLVLVAALSRETQLLIQRVENKRIRSLVTTASTDRHSSMKYRGLFSLLSRKEGIDGKRFLIQYGTPLGRWSLAEGYELWMKRWAEA